MNETASGRGNYVSIGIVFAIISACFAIATWIGSIESKVNENRNRIELNNKELIRLSELRLQIDMRIFDQLNTIKQKVSKIEGYLESQKEYKDKKK